MAHSSRRSHSLENLKNISIEVLTRETNKVLAPKRKAAKNTHPVDNSQQVQVIQPELEILPAPEEPQVEMAMNQEQLQAIMEAINRQSQAQAQQVLDLTTRQQNTVDQLTQHIQRNQHRHPHARDLPQFSGLSFDDPTAFLMRFDAVASAYNWTDAEKLANFPLALQGNALKWFKTHPAFPDFNQLVEAFRKTFGKT